MTKKIIIVMSILVLSGILSFAMYLMLPKTVHIAYTSDSKYLPYMMVSIHSAIKNKNKSSEYHIHVIAKDLNNKETSILKEMETDNVKISIHPTEKIDLDLSHLGRFASFAVSLQKIFISKYLQNVDKVLYLDSDTLVLNDLTKVYKTDIKEDYVAAVKDGLMYQHPEHVTELNLDWRNFYFNSGIMLLNLKKIREDDIVRKAIIYFNTHQEVFGDQDVLNVVFKEKVKPLSYKYNCNSTFFEEKDAEFLSNFYKEPIASTSREVYDNAVILHFAGHKPWTPWFSHDYLKKLWQTYASEIAVK